MKNVLVTGCSGFIGFHLSQKLMSNGFRVIGVDMMNDYYDINLKKKRLFLLKKYDKRLFTFIKLNVSSNQKLESVFLNNKIDYIVHLAAQAGVRDSITNPHKYLNYNITGFLNILELAAKFKIKHLVYASTSSIYGLNNKFPFSVRDVADHQIQFYAVSKKTNELMAHTWSHLYNLPATGLRFFTVYGPWGRPDMALYKFAKNIIKNKKISVFNNGNHVRDFTYIDDIVDGIYLALNKIPKPIKSKSKIDSSNSYAPHRIYNLGYGKEIKLLKFIRLIEKNIGKKAKINFLPMQAGDVHRTSADISDTQKDLGYMPKFSVENGVKNFIDWFKTYHNY
tara:strand:+ start:4585 stop:5595 length:1011 start_codon:yes stop_codon:yes gene_type:complete